LERDHEDLLARNVSTAALNKNERLALQRKASRVMTGTLNSLYQDTAYRNSEATSVLEDYANKRNAQLKSSPGDLSQAGVRAGPASLATPDDKEKKKINDSRLNRRRSMDDTAFMEVPAPRAEIRRRSVDDSALAGMNEESKTFFGNPVTSRWRSVQAKSTAIVTTGVTKCFERPGVRKEQEEQEGQGLRNLQEAASGSRSPSVTSEDQQSGMKRSKARVPPPPALTT
jgi:hypothetical protein